MLNRKTNSIYSSPDMDLLVALTLCVRAFSREQIAVGYFAGNARKADRRLSEFLAKKLLVTRSLLVRQLPIPTAPLFAWSVGDKPPAFQSLVASIRHRWESVETKKAMLYLRGPVASQLLGGSRDGGLKRPLQASHDIGLAGVYLAVRRDRPEIAKFWFGEDVSKKEQGQIPDAVYLNDEGHSAIAFEFCGLYSAARLKRFHQHCAMRELPYELW